MWSPLQELTDIGFVTRTIHDEMQFGGHFLNGPV